MQSLAPLIKAGLGMGPAAVGQALPAAATAALPLLQRLFSTGTTKRLYVGNLNFQTKAEQLAQHFGAYGSVQDVVIPLDNMGRSRGYAFVEMDTEGAESAVGSLNQSDFMGRTIWVNEARPREERPPRGERGGYGGGRGGGRGGYRQRQQQDDWEQQ
uniref:RRM domain-containing protein n=1 Tax=Tetradesmus obliquus TaxID=3088 RepID=A0A383W8Z6_TETOB|eukprot:jgi/Sobl393_1/2808/SZX73891.1